MANYTVTCLICGKDIETYNSAKNVCAGECRKIANRLHAKEFMRKKRAEEKLVITKICVLCKKEYNSHKLSTKVICLECEIAKSKLPTKTYDTSKVDNEGIVIGVNQK